MKKHILTLIILLLFGIVINCNSNKDPHTSFELSNTGNTYYRFFEMDGTSSDGQEYKLDVIYGYSINNGTEIGPNKRQAAILNSFITETIEDYIVIKLRGEPLNRIAELKRLNSDLEHNIIEHLPELNRAIEDQDIEVIKLNLTMQN